jgi:hypothetical protein
VRSEGADAAQTSAIKRRKIKQNGIEGMRSMCPLYAVCVCVRLQPLLGSRSVAWPLVGQGRRLSARRLAALSRTHQNAFWFYQNHLLGWNVFFFCFKVINPVARCARLRVASPSQRVIRTASCVLYTRTPYRLPI